MFIIFDLDGTLANIEHRLHFIRTEGQKPDWDSFHKACVNDEPIVPMIKIFQAMRRAHGIEIWSGRSKMVSDETISWLRIHDIVPDRIRMREEGDYTPDHILKQNWLQEKIYLRLKPDLVFDDRSRLVQMWRNNGIQCCQVANGEF